MKILKINHKKIRAEVIAEYLKGRRAFAFSCGNATRWLKRAGVNCVPIDGTPLEAHGYIDPEVAEFYFDAFNATSGYLPLFLVERIVGKIREKIYKPASRSQTIYVPRGSGELAFSICFIYPSQQIVTFSSQRHPATKQDVPYPLDSFFIQSVAGHLELNHLSTIEEFKDYLQTRVAKPDDIFIDTSEAEK